MGRVGTDSFLLAWGTTDGDGNTIGRDSVPLGSAVVEVAGRRVSSERNWVEVTNLAPDTEYPYRYGLQRTACCHADHRRVAE
ncbi:MAG: Metallophos protein [Acidobacteria bacterium]|nr:Metallophos protein [Acidobacteriota bacterium]